MEEPKALVLVAAFETTFYPFPFQRCCLLEHDRALLVGKKIDLVSFSLRGGNDFFKLNRYYKQQQQLYLPVPH